MTDQRGGPQFEPERVDRLLSALVDERNRLVLDYFRDAGEDVATVADLAAYVAEEQSGTDEGDTDRTAVWLHHAGLPKLDESGILEYDARDRMVRSRDHPVVEDGIGALVDVEALAEGRC